MDIKIEFPSGKEFDRLLADMDRKVGVALLRKIGTEAMEPVLADVIQHAGFDAKGGGPHMRDNIKITTQDQTKNSKYPTAVTVRVGVSKAHHIKAWAQEVGTRKQVAKPFLRPGLDYNRQEVLRILAVRLGEALRSK